MTDTSPHDTSGGAASAITVRGRSGSTAGPSGSHYIIGPLQKASGPRKKEKTAMSHFWDMHHKIAGQKIVSEMSCVFRSCRGVNIKICKGLAKSPPILLY